MSNTTADMLLVKTVSICDSIHGRVQYAVDEEVVRLHLLGLEELFCRSVHGVEESAVADSAISVLSCLCCDDRVMVCNVGHSLHFLPPFPATLEPGAWRACRVGGGANAIRGWAASQLAQRLLDLSQSEQDRLCGIPECFYPRQRRDIMSRLCHIGMARPLALCGGWRRLWSSTSGTSRGASLNCADKAVCRFRGHSESGIAKLLRNADAAAAPRCLYTKSTESWSLLDRANRTIVTTVSKKTRQLLSTLFARFTAKCTYAFAMSVNKPAYSRMRLSCQGFTAAGRPGSVAEKAARQASVKPSTILPGLPSRSLTSSALGPRRARKAGHSGGFRAIDAQKVDTVLGKPPERNSSFAITTNQSMLLFGFFGTRGSR